MANKRLWTEAQRKRNAEWCLKYRQKMKATDPNYLKRQVLRTQEYRDRLKTEGKLRPESPERLNRLREKDRKRAALYRKRKKAGKEQAKAGLSAEPTTSTTSQSRSSGRKREECPVMAALPAKTWKKPKSLQVLPSTAPAASETEPAPVSSRVDYFGMTDDVSETVELDVKPVIVYTRHLDNKHVMMTTLCKTGFPCHYKDDNSSPHHQTPEPAAAPTPIKIEPIDVEDRDLSSTVLEGVGRQADNSDKSFSTFSQPLKQEVPSPRYYLKQSDDDSQTEEPLTPAVSLVKDDGLCKPSSSSISHGPAMFVKCDNSFKNEEIPQDEEDLSLNDDDKLIPEKSDTGSSCVMATADVVTPSADGREITPSNIGLYGCKQCPVMFNTKYMLQEHTITHSGDKTFSCNMCESAFPKKSSLALHQLIHKNAKRFSCTFCDARFQLRKDLNAHVMTHNNDNDAYKDCTFCDAECKTSQEHNVHKCTHAVISKPENTCTVCNAVFNYRSNLRRHERVHTGVKPFPCSFCGLSFRTGGTKKLHEKIHTGEKPFSCPYCNLKCRTKNRLNIHIRTHTGEKPYKCEFCDARFANRGGYTSHMTVHTDAKPFSCAHCNASFKRVIELRQHERTHTGEKPYQCEYCDAKFSQIGNYKVHVRVHTGDKPFRCDKCDARFTNSSSLKYHLNTHLKVKPYRCDICGMGFNRKRSLRSHQRMHTGKLPYACSQCDAVYNTIGSLKNHQLTHTGERPFACDVCGVGFRLKATLKTHATVHTGIKAYSCRFCDAKLSNSGGLKYHEMIHTGEKPFSCEMCGASFRAKSVLKHHYKTCQSQEKS